MEHRMLGWTDIARRALASHDVPVAQWVPVSYIVNDTTLITRKGTYLRIWKLEGVPWETATPDSIALHHETHVHWLNSLEGGAWRVYKYRIQRYAYARLTPIAGASYSALLDEEIARLNAEHPFLISEIYLVLEYIPERLRAKARLGSDRRTPAQIADDEVTSVRALDEGGAAMERALSAHEPRVLGEYERNGVRFSEPAEFVGYTINGDWARVRADCGFLPQVLPRKRIAANAGAVELIGIADTRCAAMLDLKEYVNVQPGILNGLLLEEAEFLEVQAWEPMVRRDGVSSMKRNYNFLLATEDVSVTQRERLQVGMDAVEDGRESQGYYGFGLAVFARTAQEALNRAAAIAGSVMQDARGLQMAKVDLLADDGWKFQCPGSFDKRPRKVEITSSAFAAMSPDHGMLLGKRFGNPWGEAWNMHRTASGRAFMSSVHESNPKRDEEGKPLSGDVLLTGVKGAGKSSLLCVYMVLSRRFYPAPRIVVFDKDNSNEICIRRMGGLYFRFWIGEPTGLNPFRRPRKGTPTPVDENNWYEITLRCADSGGVTSTPDEKADLRRSVHVVAGMPAYLRGLTRIRENLRVKTAQGPGLSLYDRIAPWCRGGPLGWVFDEEDTLPDPQEAQIIGFDYSTFLDRPELRGPITLALIHYLDQMIDGRRLMLVFEEAWKVLDDDELALKARDVMKTLRKKNGTIWQVTQEPADSVLSKYGRTMVSQTSTFMALGDRGAKREIYVDKMFWTPEEMEIIRTLNLDGGHKFLFKQPSTGTSVVLDLDLTGLDDHLAILSGTEENVRLLDEIRAQVGDDPADWEPIFLDRVRQRKARTHARRSV
jgi:type IV secretion system protein VirB4